MLKITIIAMGNKMPSWVEHGLIDYKKRFYDGITVNIIEIPLLARGKSTDLSRIIEKETAMIETAIPANVRLIALDVNGKSFTSEELASKLEHLKQVCSHLCFLIGGPEGLASRLNNRCDERWSLSKLTLPHTLARITLLETLYRSWSIINNHPYHK
ncbi:MAG: 23S rRNA (pseudouridine(1915)-N(3))-methyltransferase RlmH [Legionella sp.]